jgi:hypothetical protein
MRKRNFQDRVYDDGFWFTLFHPFTCPVCDGEGGYSEPDEPCNFCKDRGHVGVWAKILTLNDFFLDGIISNIRYARERRKQKDNTERLRDSVTDEINGEDVDPTPD